MEQELAIKITNTISAKIAQEAPYVEYSMENLKLAKQLLADWERHLYSGVKEIKGEEDCFESFYVIRELSRTLGIWREEFEDYLFELLCEARKLNRDDFLENAFLQEIKIPDVKMGQFTLCHAAYAAGELFQYDMPDFTKEIVVPKLGFFGKKVEFPGIYEGVIPWVSVCPSEINSMNREIKHAYGRTLVLGLGLGYYPFMISRKEDVTSVTIIEKQKEIIQIFEKHILPQFVQKDKIKIVHADAYDYLETVEDGQFDYCFADIWESQIDGAEDYLRIKEYERRLPSTEFSYWIETSIRWWINGE